ncbi:MAG: hypothetical protein ABIC68_06185 [Candidatus Omnitrophota bacterium]
MKRLTFAASIVFVCLFLTACKENYLDINPHDITRVVIRDSYGSITTKDRTDIKALLRAINKAVPDPQFSDTPKITTIQLYLNNRLAYTLVSAKSLFNLEETQYCEKTGAFDDAVSAIKNRRRAKAMRSKLDQLQQTIEKI